MDTNTNNNSFLIVAKKRQTQSLSSSSKSSSISSNQIWSIIEKLRYKRNRSSTRKNYYVIWKTFSEFFVRLDQRPESWEDRILLYVGYLIEKKHKTSTINSYVSALKTILREEGIKVQEDQFLLNSLLRAARFRAGYSVTIRMPIQKPMLITILKQVDKDYLEGQSPQPYLAALYKAMFAAGYYGLLRIGEVAKGTHPIMARDVQLGDNKKKIMFILRSSKTHWVDEIPQIVKITSIQQSSSNQKSNITPSEYCPYSLLKSYADMRPEYAKDSEPFFVFKDRTPVSTSMVSKVLKNIIHSCGIDERKFTFHSFRSGRGVDLLQQGVSVETIKKIGRWKFNAVFKYLNKFS